MKLHWILLSLIAVFSFAIMVTLINYVSRKGYPLAFILCGLFLIGFVAYAIQTYQTTQFKFSVPLPILGLIFVMGILSFVGNWAQFQAANTAPNPGLAIAIVSLQAGIIALIAGVLFKDKMTMLQAVGLIVALIGVVLISLGGKTKNENVSMGKNQTQISKVK